MKLFWITLLISSLVSCHNFKEDRQLSFALERAGENRRELEQVLEHYKNDSLKYRAACFQFPYLQPIITQYFIDNKSEIWLLFLIAHSKR